MFASTTLSAAVYNSTETPQFTSRNEQIATVNPSGAMTAMSVGSTFVVAAVSGSAQARDSIRVRVYSDSCGGARPDFGGVATAEERKLFSYDINAPLGFTKIVQSTTNGVEFSKISYNSPDGGVVTGLMWDPIGRTGLRPGMIIMHGHPARASDMAGIGQNYSQLGAVAIAIDAPFARRTTGPFGMTLTPLDRAEQIQTIKDLQRAVDVLRSRSNVDHDRIVFAGYSWGAASGALFVGIERRLRAAALVVGHPGQVSHATGPGGFKYIAALPCAVRVAWIRAMTSIEPIRFVGNANVPLLIQNGTADEFIPVYEAAELHVVAPQPKDVRWYDAGHGLTQQAGLERQAWLLEKMGLPASSVRQ